jgi:DNA repair photolyase
MERRFGGGRYTGELCLIEKEFDIHYGKGRTIFIEHCNDLFAKAVPDEWIERILAHTCEWPDNEYVFQTKNPARMDLFRDKMPPRRLLGVTIETADADVAIMVSKAPTPYDRYWEMKEMSNRKGERTFVTVEPILRGPAAALGGMIRDIAPEFVNIGADSKGTDLDEPTGEAVEKLIDTLRAYNVPIRKKVNLERLLA